MAEAKPVPNRALPAIASDLRGLSRLGIDATLGVIDLVEAMHHAIASRTGIVGAAPPGRTGGITGFVYGAVRGTTRAVGHGLDALLTAFAGSSDTTVANPQREAMVAALNGLWGDHLADTANPLAIPMTLRIGGKALDLANDDLAAKLPAPTGKLVVLVHGLCMNDLQWNRHGHEHGAALARDLGFTPLYLHYNSGRHVSQNGRDFAALLEQLVRRWPVPVNELVVLGHSMGGLVARSACHYAGEAGFAWPGSLTKLVFLGTPHQGAPLERGGHLVDTLLGFSPYVAPFGRLGRARSAGITDLRYGNLQDADWQGREHHAQKHDDRRPTPLPAGVDAYFVAATRAQAGTGLASTAIGDGLVPLASALGEHRDPALALAVPTSHQRVIEGANHWDLLNRAEVHAQLVAWLGPRPDGDATTGRQSPRR